MGEKKRRFSWEGALRFFDWGIGKIVFFVVAVAAILVGLIILAHVALIVWFGSQVLAPVPAPAASSSSLPAVAPSSSVADLSLIPPPAPAGNNFNGSFTELFSGTGWVSATETTAYLDPTATAISLTPKFTVTPAPISTSGTITGEQIPALPENVTGTVAQANGIYTVSAMGHVVTSSYQGLLRFGYDPATGNTLVVYAAYYSIVFQISRGGAVTDYSERFGPRAFGGSNIGELAVQPVIFAEGGGWWIASGDGSSKPFLERISGSAVVDYASLAFPTAAALRAAPGTEPHTVLVTADGQGYLLRDEGFKQSTVQWISLRLNDWNGAISRAIVSRTLEGEAFVHYFLSNNGGDTWVSATPGTPVTFSHAGGDFRFKVELSPVAGDQYATPWVSVVEMEYLIKTSLN